MGSGRDSGEGGDGSFLGGVESGKSSRYGEV